MSQTLERDLDEDKALYLRERYARLRAAGRCVECGRKHDASTARCEGCRAARRTRKCLDCPAPAVRNRKRCAACAERDRAAQKSRRDAARRSGRCACGEAIEPRFASCRSCRLAARARKHRSLAGNVPPPVTSGNHSKPAPRPIALTPYALSLIHAADLSARIRRNFAA